MVTVLGSKVQPPTALIFQQRSKRIKKKTMYNILFFMLWRRSHRRTQVKMNGSLIKGLCHSNCHRIPDFPLINRMLEKWDLTVAVGKRVVVFPYSQVWQETIISHTICEKFGLPELPISRSCRYVSNTSSSVTLLSNPFHTVVPVKLWHYHWRMTMVR